jgi:diketogulonate reductase-like aldo/keto reductase
VRPYSRVMNATRRTLLRWLAALPFAGVGSAFAQRPALLTRKIPSSGEAIPVVGLGSWITFNVGDDRVARDRCAAVIQTFLESGGTLIDSSPMYGSSQEVIGAALAKLGKPRVFSADKVWISSGSRGPAQIEESRRHWGVARFDLLQVHNLLAWEDHLRTLAAMKKAGRLRYLGVTTSHGRRHGDLEEIMRRERLDFVQLTYNPLDRDVEQRLLPLARERGIAVIVNRPFQQGDLTEELARHPLPAWAREIGCRSWAQVILKWIVAHPAVTCAIPATSVVAHARENLDAARGPLPDAAMRQRIVREIERLV